MIDKELNINKLSTEKRNTNSLDIDCKNSLEICEIMNNEDALVHLAVRNALEDIAKVIDIAVESFKKGGRLIYVGAGTSGRIGLIDAVECRPTFSCDDEMVQCVLAGGSGAFISAKEGAEDDADQAVVDLKNINLSQDDFVIGITASGRTPYVISAVDYAKSIGCKTGSIATAMDSKIAKHVDCKIEAVTGAEVVTGSTRLKSGTAQKLICNMISTGSMIQMGKVYKNLMVDVKATNEKLVKRAVNIVKEITGANEEVCLEKMMKYKNAKKASLSILSNIDDDKELSGMLNKHGGNLRKALKEIGIND